MNIIYSYNEINIKLAQGQYSDAIHLCKELNLNLLASVLTDALSLPSIPSNSTITVKLLCNWLSSDKLCKLWNKMSQDNNYKWNNIQITSSNVADYYVIINRPQHNDYYEAKKTILFQMEPHMIDQPEIWGEEWSNPDSTKFFKVITHKEGYNNIEWHLSKSYSELLPPNLQGKSNSLSAILSSKYNDIGHKKRIDFVKFLDTKDDLNIDVFGTNLGYKNYKGTLPYHTKDNGLFPYKYHFACENHSIPNYFTEKLIDGILAGCLVFYWGCPNVEEYIDGRAFIRLELNNFEEDYKKIKESIENYEWEMRIGYILDM